MWTAFFTDQPVFDYPSAKRADVSKFAKFFHALLDEGVYLPPSQFEAAFVSVAHSESEVETTLAAVEKLLRRILATKPSTSANSGGTSGESSSAPSSASIGFTPMPVIL